MVGRDQSLARPAFLDDLDQFLSDVDAEPIVPPVLEPFLQFESGIVVEHVDVQLALPGKAGESQVAAAQVAHDRVDGVVAEQQVELRVQRVAQEELDDNPTGAKLRRQSPQSQFVRVGGYADGQLLAQLLGELDSKAMRSLVVDARIPIQ